MLTSHDVNTQGNAEDVEYDAFRARVNARFAANTADNRPLFTTDAAGLWEAYLDALPTSERQHHTCHACRHFIQRFGDLVTMDANGAITPAVWNEEDAPALYRPALAGMARVVRRSKVTGVFLASEKVYGTPVTGNWRHLAVTPDKKRIFKHSTLTPFQVMAEKKEDFKILQTALNEFKQEQVETALTLLKSEALYRSEKVLGPVQWFYDLLVSISANRHARTNLTWLAVATAPTGFCHIRSAMAGTLLEDIAAGMPFADVSKRFAAKMHPLQYQRPQAAPTAGNIAVAEKRIAELKAAGALKRRFARLEEIDTIWRPTVGEKQAAGGVFGHLVPKGETPTSTIAVPTQTLTWEKFARTVLPEAREIEFQVPWRGNFTGILTAEDPDAPPILQWDSEERRNPFSSYVYNGGSSAGNWRLATGWNTVTAITLRPEHWYGGEYAHFSPGAILVLEGARDKQLDASALFPEILKSEFRKIRSTIEAYSQSAAPGGRAQASACGYGLGKGSVDNVHLRVTAASGPQMTYKIDRWD